MTFSRFGRAVLAVSLISAVGCLGAGGAMMTPTVIEQAGTQAFKAPYEKVFTATVNALKGEGFPIAMAEPEKGLIKTGQKIIRSVAVGGNHTAVAVDVTRQYVIHVGKAGDGIVVSAEPRIFQGNAELTDQPIWDLDSPQGERALWKRLFRDIQEAL
jgi:hypothetical protein